MGCGLEKKYVSALMVMVVTLGYSHLHLTYPFNIFYYNIFQFKGV
jgi:hypothetical protein